MGTDLEVLALGNCFLRKEDQDPNLIKDYKTAFELDCDNGIPAIEELEVLISPKGNVRMAYH